MTADIRTAARKEAAEVFIEPRKRDLLPADYIAKGGREGFLAGAEWAVRRVTPTREQIAERIDGALRDWLENNDKTDTRLREEWAADAVLAIMAGLAEGEAR